MHIADVLQLDEPFGEFIRLQIEAILLMGDIVILTEDAAKVATREEDGA